MRDFTNIRSKHLSVRFCKYNRITSGLFLIHIPIKQYSARVHCITSDTKDVDFLSTSTLFLEQLRQRATPLFI